MAESIDSTLAAITPLKKSRIELYQSTVKSRKVEKILSEEPIMPAEVADVINYCNYIMDRDEEIRAIATLVPRYDWSFLKLFNKPKSNPDENPGVVNMEIDGAEGKLYWKRELTYHRYHEADLHYRMTGHGLCPITKPEITRQRIKREVALDIFEFITSSDIQQRTAFGTYKVRTSKGIVHTVAKHVRKMSIAELIRKVTAYLKDYKGYTDEDIPKEGYLRKVISGVPALRSKKLRGITAQVEYGKFIKC